jgi:hypothetical protein
MGLTENETIMNINPYMDYLKTIRENKSKGKYSSPEEVLRRFEHRDLLNRIAWDLKDRKPKNAIREVACIVNGETGVAWLCQR